MVVFDHWLFIQSVQIILLPSPTLTYIEFTSSFSKVATMKSCFYHFCIKQNGTLYQKTLKQSFIQLKLLLSLLLAYFPFLFPYHTALLEKILTSQQSLERATNATPKLFDGIALNFFTLASPNNYGTAQYAILCIKSVSVPMLLVGGLCYFNKSSSSQRAKPIPRLFFALGEFQIHSST